MTSSITSPQPTPTFVGVRPAWEFAAVATVRTLALAREKGCVLAWDESQWLYLLDRSGKRQAQVPAPRPLAAICCSDDGSAWAAVGMGGEVWWLAPDLMPRWQRALAQPAVAAAMDPFGQYLAAADSGGQLTLFDRSGKTICQT